MNLGNRATNTRVYVSLQPVIFAANKKNVAGSDIEAKSAMGKGKTGSKVLH
jgi:hypothetical protein